MVKSKLIGPAETTFLEYEPKFWYRDEHGKATPVELEYLLPLNNILLEETYSDQGVWGKKVESQAYMGLPYFPGDIYLNDKAVPHPKNGLLFSTRSAERNGAWIQRSGSADIAPRVSETHYNFHYEGKIYFVRTVRAGTSVVLTKDGKRGYAVNNYVRFYAGAEQSDPMLTVADLNPNDPAALRMMSCLGTLLTANALGSIVSKLRREDPNPFLMGPMDSYDLDLVGRKDWTAGPF